MELFLFIAGKKHWTIECSRRDQDSVASGRGHSGHRKNDCVIGGSVAVAFPEDGEADEKDDEGNRAKHSPGDIVCGLISIAEVKL